jgi:hypothetical protein
MMTINDVKAGLHNSSREPNLGTSKQEAGIAKNLSHCMHLLHDAQF